MAVTFSQGKEEMESLTRSLVSLCWEEAIKGLSTFLDAFRVNRLTTRTWQRRDLHDQ